jgi:hypothetical protein
MENDVNPAFPGLFSPSKGLIKARGEKNEPNKAGGVKGKLSAHPDPVESQIQRGPRNVQT